MMVHVSFWKWYEDFSKSDNRFAPSEKGLVLLKRAWEQGMLQRQQDMYNYMIAVMRQFDNPRAKM